MMANNIYVPFVLQNMVGSKTPQKNWLNIFMISKLAIKKPRINLSDLNCTVYKFLIDVLSIDKLYNTRFLD